MSATLPHPIRTVSLLLSADARLDALTLLVGLRWLAIAGQLGAVAVAAGPLGIALPLAPLLGTIGALAAFNLASQRLASRRLAQPAPRAGGVGGGTDRLMLSELLVDVVALASLLYWSGGADNPFVGLFLLPLSIGAAVLPAFHVAVLLTVSVAAFAGLHVAGVPIDWPGWVARQRLELAGSVVSFLLSAALIALFVTRMTASLRERDRLLARERESKLRDQQIVALGALATGALHELGTPLSTINVVVGELLEGVSDARLADDLQLIAAQVDACKRTLSRLAAQAGAPRGERARAQPLSAWLDQTVAHWRALAPRTEMRWQCDGRLAGLQVAADETLRQALLNLLTNAVQFSPERVDVHARLQDDALVVEIRDYGPGISQAVAACAGRTPRTTRDGGMGLGLYLAHAAVERFGGRIDLDNHAEGGLLTRMSVPLQRWQV